MCKFPNSSSSYFVFLQEEDAIQVMETSSVMLPSADGSEAREAHSSHLDGMSLTTSPSEDQDIAGNMQQEHLEALDDQIDELQQRLVALTADSSPSKSSNASFKTAREQTSPTKPSQKALGKRKEEKSPKKPNQVALPPPGSILQSTTITQTSTRPTTSHRASATQGSTAPTSQVPSASSSKREARAPASSTRPPSRRVITGPDASAASSRRSSFLISPPAANQSVGPVRKHRRSNTTWPPLAPTSIPNPKQALQSLQTFSDLRDDVLAGMQAEERAKLSTSLPTLPRQTTANATATQASSSPNENPQTPAEYSNHVPAANIDWTLPSTRRREYEKIDKARRGFRGLMRRVTPRFLLKNGRVGFHDAEDGKGSDAGGTVRRFRMDVGDDDDSVVGEEEGAKSAWWKFGKKKNGKGKKDESSAEAGN